MEDYEKSVNYFVPEILLLIGKAEVKQTGEKNEKGIRRDKKKILFLFSASTLPAA